jgi:hypothetical protein
VEDDAALGAEALMKDGNERSPGQYAAERYALAFRTYRRRMRRPVLVVSVPPVIVTTSIALWLDRDPWWWLAGAVWGGILAVAFFTLGVPPAHVGKWGVGAMGERRTAKALRPLLRRGWTVTHDVQRARENLDHVLVGPPGVFLLETKVRTGVVSIEAGVLTIRYPDDPEEVVRLPYLTDQMHRRARDLRETHRFENGVPHRVTPVVVLWANFPDRCVESDGVIYVHGDELVTWLRSLPRPTVFRAEFLQAADWRSLLHWRSSRRAG